MSINETEFSYDQIQEYYNSCRLCSRYNNRLDQIYNKLYKDILNIKDFRELVTQFMKELKEAYELLKIMKCEIEVDGAGYVLDYNATTNKVIVRGIGELEENKFEELIMQTIKILSSKINTVSPIFGIS